MSGVCADCPGPVGCCYTAAIDDDDDDLDDRSWSEWIGDVIFQPILWVIVISIALGIAGLFFAAGAWGFKTGIDLLSQI